MVPSDATIQLQPIFLLIVHVHTHHLGSNQALTTGTPTTTATRRETHVVHIVGITHQEHLQVIFHPSKHDTSEITVVCTSSQIGVQQDTLVHTGFDTEVEHGFLFSIVHTADTSHVALLVVSLHAIHDTGGQILHGSLRITHHEFLTIHHNLLYFLTVNGYLAVVIHLGTWQSFYQFLHHRTLWCTECSSIIDKGVSLQRYLGSISSYRCTLQHHSIGPHGNLTQCHIFIGCHRYMLGVRLISHTGYLDDISSISRSLHTKTSLKVRQSTCYECAIHFQQPNTALCHRFMCVAFHHVTRNMALSHCQRDDHRQK